MVDLDAMDLDAMNKATQQGKRLSLAVNLEIRDSAHSEQEILLISALVISGALGVVTARLGKDAANKLWEDMRGVIGIGHAQIEANEQGVRH